MQTEQSYVDSLNLVVEVLIKCTHTSATVSDYAIVCSWQIFMEPMAAKCILNSEELHTVFVNWKDLITSHDKLLKSAKFPFSVGQTIVSFL